ncbi:MAG TPA: hypothetical protein VH134_17015 [Candidatus Dormibacteraeota bacterium]|jgi:photosystem II stability/assembly factor-like uncharacterized protein|nr:hypothetical protein [Candidatus Dormibacteraeota bacterium]
MIRPWALGAALLLTACGGSSSTGVITSPTGEVGSAAPSAAPTQAADCLTSSSPPPPSPASGTQVPALATIQFAGPRQGWAAGRGRILTTTDAGATWTAQYQGPEQVTFVDFVSSSTGWAVTLDALLGTTDGGHCWRRLGEPAQSLVSVHFIDAQNGWGVSGSSTAQRANGLPNTLVLGDGPPVQPAGGGLVVTTDGGHSWRSAPGGTPADVQSVCFSDPGHGWLGAGGHVYRSSDRGAGWHEVPGLPAQPGSSGVISLECALPDSAWMLDLTLEGAAGNQPYSGLASVGGQGIVELFADQLGGAGNRTPPGSYPGPFSVISASTAAFAGETPPLPANPVGLVQATVSGASVTVTAPVQVAGIDRAWGASFASASTGWLVADTGQDGHAVILVTTDGGHSWTRQYSTGA